MTPNVLTEPSVIEQHTPNQTKPFLFLVETPGRYDYTYGGW